MTVSFFSRVCRWDVFSWGVYCVRLESKCKFRIQLIILSSVHFSTKNSTCDNLEFFFCSLSWGVWRREKDGSHVHFYDGQFGRDRCLRRMVWMLKREHQQTINRLTSLGSPSPCQTSHFPKPTNPNINSTYTIKLSTFPDPQARGLDL